MRVEDREIDLFDISYSGRTTRSRRGIGIKMKIKADFVTNSSSAGYILGLAKHQVEDFRSFVSSLHEHEYAANEGVQVSMLVDSLEELDQYVNEGPIDWAQKPTGPRFERMVEEHYNICKKHISHGGVAVEIWVDYNVCDEFQEEYEDCILEGLY